MDCTIRPAVAADAATITEFNIRMALETEHKRLDPALALRGVEEGLRRTDLCRYFVAEGPDGIIGQAMITYEWSDWRSGVFWWIQSVYVHPDYRGRGVFRAIYSHIASMARAAPDSCGLRLYVEAENSGARATYLRLGMKTSGHVVYEDDWSGRR